MAVVTRADFSGPFFTRDPKKTVRENIGRMMEDLAGEAEADVKAQIAGRSGSMAQYTGWTHDSVKGRVTSQSGKRWALSAVVSANTAGMDARAAIRTKAAAATIERRWHVFRRTTSAMRRARAVIAANLTRGLE